MKLEAIVAVDKAGNFMGIDDGYLWVAFKGDTASALRNVHFFESDGAANQYLERYPEYQKRYVTITIEETEDPIEELYKDWQNKIEKVKYYSSERDKIFASDLVTQCEQKLYDKLAGRTYLLKSGYYLLPTSDGKVVVLERRNVN